MSVSGEPLATLVGDLIFKGKAVSGMPIAKISGTRSYKGISPSGSPLVTVPSADVPTLLAATYHVLFG